VGDAHTRHILQDQRLRPDKVYDRNVSFEHCISRIGRIPLAGERKSLARGTASDQIDLSPKAVKLSEMHLKDIVY